MGINKYVIRIFMAIVLSFCTVASYAAYNLTTTVIDYYKVNDKFIQGLFTLTAPKCTQKVDITENDYGKSLGPYICSVDPSDNDHTFSFKFQANNGKECETSCTWCTEYTKVKVEIYYADGGGCGILPLFSP